MPFLCYDQNPGMEIIFSKSRDDFDRIKEYEVKLV